MEPLRPSPLELHTHHSTLSFFPPFSSLGWGCPNWQRLGQPGSLNGHVENSCPHQPGISTLDFYVRNNILHFFVRPTNRARVGSSVAAVNITLGYTLTHQLMLFQFGNCWALTIGTWKTYVLTRFSLLTSQESRNVGTYQEN